MKKSVVDPFVFTKKAVFMQRVSDLARLSYHRYVEGQIPIAKAQFFAQKMDLYYNCFLNKTDAHRARMRGLATARLLFYQAPQATHLTWILMLTEGEWPTPYRGKERWRDPTIDRIIHNGYELVRHIRAGNAKPSWTWRYTSSQYDELRNMLVLAIRRKNTNELTRLIDLIYRSPAFAGVREQVKKMAKLIVAEWTRTGVGDMPEIPKGLGYVRRLPDKGTLLSKIMKGEQIADT